MTVLVTGAGGFIGRHVVERLLDDGHRVRSLVWPSEHMSQLSWNNHENVEIVCGDLKDARCRLELVKGVTTVVHLAATRAKSWELQRELTAQHTQAMVEATFRAKIAQFVLASSFSIYDYACLPRDSAVDEESPLIADSWEHGPYPWGKLQQDQAVRRAGEDHKLPYTILRLGAVYGPGATWTHRLGIIKGGRCIRFGSSARVPLTYVRNVADAIAATVTCGATNKVLNVVDDDPPTQRQFASELLAYMNPRVKVIPISYGLARVGADCLWLVAGCLGQRKQIPLTLRPMCIDAVGKPMMYPNDRIKQSLEWAPRVNRAEALRHIFGAPI